MLKKSIKSFVFAISGFAFAFRNHFNLRIHILIMVLVLGAAFFFSLNPMEWCILLLCISSVIAAELVNTSLEISVDLSTPQFNEKAGHAKDVAAASVLMVCIVSAIIGLIIFIPKIINFLKA